METSVFAPELERASPGNTVPAIIMEPELAYAFESANTTPAIVFEPDSPFAVDANEIVPAIQFEPGLDAGAYASEMQSPFGPEPGPEDFPEPLEPIAGIGAFQGFVQDARIPRLLFGLVFLAGIFIGSVALGILLWSQGQDSTPDQLPADSQQDVLYNIAEKYWQTADLKAAQRDLAGWDQGHVLQMLSDMQDESEDPQERRHLAALADGLAAPTYDPSVTTFLFGHPFVLIASVLSVLPLLAAVGYAVRVSLRGEKPPSETSADDVDLPVTQAPGIQTRQANAPPTDPGGGAETLEPEIIEAQLLPNAEGARARAEEGEGKEETELAASLGDLASVFEDVDVSIGSLQELAKGLVEISIETLVNGVQVVSSKLELANSNRSMSALAINSD